ncbi:odorant receptor 131-2-like [Denticeps clupeoides]|uniref:G-protein coupled receptors family 1 profile domain-containing protein n=1 Tax=Denticeps clupeoides TaxID=299321 RepID=A0AAY4B5U9_9TELE|nr:odorant receptor 131-2-like [Denticeps clupeoides]
MQNYTGYSNQTTSAFISKPLNDRFLAVQILVGVFLYLNCLMIFTFLKNEAFRTDTRYVLFAQMLFMDSALMVLTDLALMGIYFRCPIPVISCCVFSMIMDWLAIGTPFTLMAMCLERYVAICMPLRHGDISTPRTRRMGLLSIWLISTLMPVFTLISLLCLVPSSFFLSSTLCTVEMMIVQSWQHNARNILLLVYFIGMFSATIFSYVKIMKAARAASSQNKSSTNKGLRTVILHAFQLLLCLIRFICPFIEMAVIQIDFLIYVDLRYFNFVMFLIAPRCLSPLIYGLRDEKFFIVLRNHAFFGLYTFISPLCIKVKSSRVRTSSAGHDWK